MSLDTKQKRGSAINLGVPFRPWISEPQASSSFGSRLSFLGFFSIEQAFQKLRRFTSRFLTFPG